MNLYIEDLNLSHYTKNVLHELGFAIVFNLKGHDHISLIHKFLIQHHSIPINVATHDLHILYQQYYCNIMKT